MEENVIEEEESVTFTESALSTIVILPDGAELSLTVKVWVLDSNMDVGKEATTKVGLVVPDVLPEEESEGVVAADVEPVELDAILTIPVKTLKLEEELESKLFLPASRQLNKNNNKTRINNFVIFIKS